MPELIAKSTSLSLPNLLEANPAPDWEPLEGFRFTFLRHFAHPQEASALRQVAQILYDLVLDRPQNTDLPQDLETRSELVAALAELRFLQAYLASVSSEQKLCSLPKEALELCRIAGTLALEMDGMARRLTSALFPVEE